jgi:hypothetical protein
MWRKGAAMDGNLNNYDFEHVVSDHPKMTRAEWQAIYHEAWTSYYSRAHIETLLRRGAATGVSLMGLVKALVPFIHMVPVENIHPLQAGLFRRKHRSERKYGLPHESLWAFYSSHIAATIRNNLRLAGTILWVLRLKRRIERDPNRRSYMDIALTPRSAGDEGVLDLLTKTAGAKAAIDHVKKVAALTH